MLIEASALGVPIAAMNTGGTPDIVIDEGDGLALGLAGELAATCAGCARMKRCAGASARRQGRAESHFDSPAVVARIEQLYAELVARTR